MALYECNNSNSDYVFFGETSTTDFLSTTAKTYTVTNSEIDWTKYKDIVFKVIYLPPDHPSDNYTKIYQACYDFRGKYLCALEHYIENHNILKSAGSTWQSSAHTTMVFDSDILIELLYHSSNNTLKIRANLQTAPSTGWNFYIKIYLRR